MKIEKFVSSVYSQAETCLLKNHGGGGGSSIVKVPGDAKGIIFTKIGFSQRFHFETAGGTPLPEI